MDSLLLALWGLLGQTPKPKPPGKPAHAAYNAQSLKHPRGGVAPKPGAMVMDKGASKRAATGYSKSANAMANKGLHKAFNKSLLKTYTKPYAKTGIKHYEF